MSDTPKIIPCKIHYVWVGGPMKPDQLLEIARLAKVAKRSSFELQIWVDKESNYYTTAEKYNINIPNIKLRNVSELRENMIGKYDNLTVDELKNLVKNNSYVKANELDIKDDDLQIKGKLVEKLVEGDKKRARQFFEYVNREGVGFKNLAAASDFLRLEILHQEGGYYLDTDTQIFADSEKKDQHLNSDEPDNIILEPETVTCGIRLNALINRGPLEQNQYISIRNVEEFNNDIIIAEKGHPILRMAIDKMIQNYQLLDEGKLKFRNSELGSMDKKRDDRVRDKQKLSNRRDLTIMASGPGVLQECLKDYFRRLPREQRTFITTLESFEPIVSIAGLSITSTFKRSNAGTWLKPTARKRYFDDSAVNSLFEKHKESTSLQAQNNEVKSSKELEKESCKKKPRKSS